MVRAIVPANQSANREFHDARSLPLASSPPGPKHDATHRRSAIDFDALAEARHHDPFSILGPHVVDEGVVFRAFLPQAEQVSIIRPGGDGCADTETP